MHRSFQLDVSDVQVAAQLMDLELTEEECADILPALQRYLNCGELLRDSTTTYEISTDDARWFTS
jgi:hypothetical protein